MDILTNPSTRNESSYLLSAIFNSPVTKSHPPGRHIPTMTASNGRNFRIEG